MYRRAHFLEDAQWAWVMEGLPDSQSVYSIATSCYVPVLLEGTIVMSQAREGFTVYWLGIFVKISGSSHFSKEKLTRLIGKKVMDASSEVAWPIECVFLKFQFSVR